MDLMIARPPTSVHRTSDITDPGNRFERWLSAAREDFDDSTRDLVVSSVLHRLSMADIDDIE
jgi:hypothetical protein